MNFKNDCYECIKIIKSSAFFPVAPNSGRLRDHATKMSPTADGYVITFDSTISPYVGYLEDGTEPHDIPHAFGYGTIYKDRPNPYTGKIPFGVGGRFGGKFHPGSHLHKGFISIDSVRTITDYFINKYKGELR